VLGTYLYEKNIKNIDRVKELFIETEEPLSMVANMLGISFGSVLIIFMDSLNMHWAAAKFLPCLPSEEWKESCVSTCQNFLDWLERKPAFLSKISQVMRHGFMAMTQKPSSIYLTWKPIIFMSPRQVC
jgi:hypothetical protein